jgi:hypothetical protein
MQIHHTIKLSRSFISLCGCPCLKGLHPRHPPRAFPLWLLAPRCLCVSKAHASWGEEVSSPRVGRYTPRVLGVRPRHPHSTLCIFMFVVSLSLLDYETSLNIGAHPLAMDAHSGNARGFYSCLPLACVRVRTHALPTRARMKLLSLLFII